MTKYFCDRCGKEAEPQDLWRVAVVPDNPHAGGERTTTDLTITRTNLCPSCTQEVIDLVQKRTGAPVVTTEMVQG